MIELWSSNHDAYSHRCRIVIEEKDLGLEKGKGMSIRVRLVDINKKPEDLASINPLNQVPVLVDRDLRLYESNIINEYLDERFPHPQLMPLGVADKGKARLLLHELDWNFYSRMDAILASKPGKQQNLHRKLLAEALLGLSQRMGRTKYFTGNEFTMVDVAFSTVVVAPEIPRG